MEESGPVAVDGAATFNTQKLHEVTETCRLVYTYANGVKVTLGQGQKDIEQGARFIGSKGEVYVTRGKITTTPEEILQQPLDAAGFTPAVPQQGPHAGFSRLPGEPQESSLRDRDRPPVGDGLPSGEPRRSSGHRIKWDPKTEKIVGDEAAQAMTDREYRAPYTHNMHMATKS